MASPHGSLRGDPHLPHRLEDAKGGFRRDALAGPKKAILEAEDQSWAGLPHVVGEGMPRLCAWSLWSRGKCKHLLTWLSQSHVLGDREFWESRLHSPALNMMPTGCNCTSSTSYFRLSCTSSERLSRDFPNDRACLCRMAPQRSP